MRSPRSDRSAKGKPAEEKRATLPRRSDHTASFIKAWRRYEKSGRVDLHDVKVVMGLLVANEAPLPPQYKDHELKGEWAGTRECHVRNNHLLVYRLQEDGAAVIFVDMGTHAELFE